MAVDGWVERGFEFVAEEFRRNFDERDEMGAAFAVVIDGQPVVDLWGGTARPQTGDPWREDTLQLVFSGSKGLVAVCLLLLIERGLLRLDDPVANYWPEFGANGKHGVLVRHVVSHTAGLPGVRKTLTYADIADPALMATLLAEQRAFWPSGEVLAYHALTYGWLCGELVRRVDGRSIGRFFAEEVAEPLGLDLWIGLPESLEPRVSEISYRPTAEARPQLCDPEVARARDDNPPGLAADISKWNALSLHAAEIPAANAIGTARSIARLYGCLATGGRCATVQLLTPSSVNLGRTELSRGRDACVDQILAFGVGFQLQRQPPLFGPSGTAFGHTGAGGSVHCAWPDSGVGLSYVMNELRDTTERTDDLLRTLEDAVAANVPNRTLVV